MRLINVFVGSRPDNTMFAETSSPFFILTPEQIPSLIMIDSTFGALFPAYMINEFFSDKEIGYIFFF